MSGLERQTAIYLSGVSGLRPRVPLDVDELEARAKRAMSAEAFAYVAAGAGNEDTVAGNREAFRRWRIVPRMLRDVSERDTTVELFGRKLPGPFLLAPIGVLELAHRHADAAVARAARTEGMPVVFSNQASVPMERCAELLGDGPRWFQLYWSRSDELVESFVRRAERCGCGAIVVTLDTTILGWRPRDLTPAFLPFLRGKGIAQYTSDPTFRRLMEEQTEGGLGSRQPRPTPAALRTLIQLTRRYPDRFLRTLLSGSGRAAVQRFVEIYSRPSLTWDDLPFLRERTKLPTAIATLEALPAVVEAVGGRVPVLLDSGVRGGADAFKALALGAAAVLLGRPYVYGLAIAGERGVREVIQNHLADFDLTMGLAGCRSVAEIGPECLTSA
jgi:lactate 2-monooxygenase